MSKRHRWEERRYTSSYQRGYIVERCACGALRRLVVGPKSYMWEYRRPGSKKWQRIAGSCEAAAKVKS